MPESPCRRCRRPASPHPSAVVRPPSSWSGFIGGEALLAELATAEQSARLVTLVGPGGVGKTRAAAEHLRHRGSAVWVALAPVHEPDLVAEAVAEALGVTHQPRRAPLVGASEALRRRETVLVLDNCEHVRDAAAQIVAALLGEVPSLRVLATSRERLGIAGERVVDVPPLPLVDDSGADGPAVQLFAARAAEASSLWAPDAAGRAAVRRLCADLDGLPLALEPAAAQTRVIDPVELADEVHARTLELTSLGPTATPHHRSLQAALDWSWARLDAEQQQDLAAVAVFEGPFDLPAARALLGRDAAQALGPLVERSLVRPLPERPRRYELLQTVKTHAEQRAGEAARVQLWRRHVAWAAALAADAAPRLRSAEAGTALHGLELVRADLRTAGRRAVQLGQADVAGGCAPTSDGSGTAGGHVAEGRGLLQAVLDAAPGSAHEARARAALARLSYLNGDVARARDESVRALGTAVTPVDRIDAGYTAAWILGLTGELEPAVRTATDTHRLAQETGDLSGEAICLMVLGQLARVMPDVGDADGLLTCSVRLGTASGDRWVTVSSRWILAKTALATAAPAVAVGHAAAAARDAAEDGDDPAMLATAYVLAAALAATDGAGAARLIGAVDAVCRAVGYDVRAMDPESSWLDPLVGEATRAQPEAYAEGSAWGREALARYLTQT